jgi:hypothetical protein
MKNIHLHLLDVYIKNHIHAQHWSEPLVCLVKTKPKQGLIFKIGTKTKFDYF